MSPLGFELDALVQAVLCRSEREALTPCTEDRVTEKHSEKDEALLDHSDLRGRQDARPDCDLMTIPSPVR